MRRSIADSAEIAYFLSHAPVRTVLAEAVAAVGARWSVEECFETAKNECGLDQYEVRKWPAWYRHITPARTPPGTQHHHRPASSTPAKKATYGCNPQHVETIDIDGGEEEVPVKLDTFVDDSRRRSARLSADHRADLDALGMRRQEPATLKAANG
ncbi:hypothetical protein ACWCRF_14255 [Streptomyces sp. NPDC002405]|uniref:hypothetical protein n=1 Tax=unclassified Streptomyces TaxID=2593676 RepID=UPI003686F991